VSFDLVDYLIKNKNINNFEMVAKTLALWNTSLKNDRNKDNQITRIYLNNYEFVKEKVMLSITLSLNFFIFIYSIYLFKENVFWLKETLMLPEYISIIIMISLIVGFLIVGVFLFITTIVLFDLKRIVRLLNKCI